MTASYIVTLLTDYSSSRAAVLHILLVLFMWWRGWKAVTEEFGL